MLTYIVLFISLILLETSDVQIIWWFPDFFGSQKDNFSPILE